MKFAIIGCGAIGRKRLQAMRACDQLVIAADNDLERAALLAKASSSATATSNWKDAVTHPHVDAVVVATTNDWLAAVTTAAVKAGKHVLVEKPAARSYREICELLAEVEDRGRCIWVGFNHRYHPALQKAKSIVDSGVLGRLMFVRGRYGHGGRLGYEREWRANPEVSGGGELLDQGVHLVDLARWFLGDLPKVSGYVSTYFWQMQVDDNAFLLLRTSQDQAAWLHASCTEWKNLFCFEIYGRNGKLQIDGLGGSYGLERLTHYQVRPQMGPPATKTWEFPGEDTSWRDELQAFSDCIESGVYMLKSLQDAASALAVVEKVYRENGRWEKEQYLETGEVADCAAVTNNTER